MSVSLNEAFSLFLRASAGAGLPWGVADDVARAALWLCRYGFDGADVLASALSRIETRETSVAWSGPAWIDQVFVAEADRVVVVNADCPMLLAGLAGARLAGTRDAIELSIDDRSWIIDGDGVCRGTGVLPAISASVSMRRIVQPAGLPPVATPHSRFVLSTGVCDTLRNFARGVLVPSSESSRVRGAGAGLTDND